MDSFYRVVRKRTQILMDSQGKPEGGKLSYDAEKIESLGKVIHLLPKFRPSRQTK